MSETLFSRLKASILRTEPLPTAVRVISVTGSNDYAELPQGFFRVEAASGKKSLGYNCPAFLCWDVGPTVVVGRDRITVSVPREELPLVKLNFGKQDSVQQVVGGRGIIDTDLLDGNDGAVTWAGSAPRDGVDYV
jgi:hypothetical protein